MESFFKSCAIAFAIICVGLGSLPGIGLALNWAGYSELSLSVLLVFVALALNGSDLTFSLSFIVLALLSSGYLLYRP